MIPMNMTRDSVRNFSPFSNHVNVMHLRAEDTEKLKSQFKTCRQLQQKACSSLNTFSKITTSYYCDVSTTGCMCDWHAKV
jgi:hypothetical protein